MGAGARAWGRAAAAAASIAAHAVAVLAVVAHQPAFQGVEARAVNVQLVRAAPASPAPAAPEPRPPGRPAAVRTAASAPDAPRPGADGPARAPTAPSTPAPSTPAAPAAAIAAATAATASPVAPSPADRMEDYRRAVWARLAAHAPAAAPGSGVARVRIALTPAGALASTRLARSSGRPAFDRACLASVRAAAPFPAAPAGADPASLVFEVPIRAKDAG